MIKEYFDGVLILEDEDLGNAVTRMLEWERSNHIYSIKGEWKGNEHYRHSRGQYNIYSIKAKSLIKTKG